MHVHFCGFFFMHLSFLSTWSVIYCLRKMNFFLQRNDHQENNLCNTTIVSLTSFCRFSVDTAISRYLSLKTFKNNFFSAVSKYWCDLYTLEQSSYPRKDIYPLPFLWLLNATDDYFSLCESICTMSLGDICSASAKIVRVCGFVHRLKVHGGLCA